MFTTFTFQWCRKDIEMGEGGGLTWNKSWQAGKGERKRLMVKVKSNFTKKIGGGTLLPFPMPTWCRRLCISHVVCINDLYGINLIVKFMHKLYLPGDKLHLGDILFCVLFNILFDWFSFFLKN